jgi:hypothetical protein
MRTLQIARDAVPDFVSRGNIARYEHGVLIATRIGASATHAASQGTTWWHSLLTAGPVGVLLGFLLKTVWDWYTGRRQETRQFHAAALLVSDELRANVVKLEIALETKENPEPLASDAYYRHELILAMRLPPKARDMVRGAYIHARVPRAFEVRTKRGRSKGQWMGQTPVVEEALSKAKRARQLLSPHIPKGTAEI